MKTRNQKPSCQNYFEKKNIEKRQINNVKWWPLCYFCNPYSCTYTVPPFSSCEFSFHFITKFCISQWLLGGLSKMSFVQMSPLSIILFSHISIWHFHHFLRRNHLKDVLVLPPNDIRQNVVLSKWHLIKCHLTQSFLYSKWHSTKCSLIQSFYYPDVIWQNVI